MNESERYTNRNGFIGVRPGGSLILGSCSYYASHTRGWIVRNLSVYGHEQSWRQFYRKGYRVIRCVVIPNGGCRGGGT